ncbi:MAG: acetyl-CoA carboxylase biotin carboxyl carrier protein subunit [Anaerolineae bacterium]
MTMNPRRRLKVTVNGKPYLVEVGDLTTSPITVSVNGRPYLVSIETAAEKVTPEEEPVVALEAVARQTSAPEKAPLPTGPAGPQVDVVRAPMPGNILDVAVRAGDEVKFRQTLCFLEAMKMKNAIRSPRDGVIASVEVSEGQTVSHGDILFTFAEKTPSTQE